MDQKRQQLPPRLEIPGQCKVSFKHQPAPNAEQHVLSQQVPGGLQVVLYGGLTKLEYAAIHLAAGAILEPEIYSATDVVALAAELLEECNRVQFARPDTPEGNGDG